MRLSNRIALVTGSSRGIGAAIARRLAADGAKIILHARARSDKVLATAESIRAAGGTAHVVYGDLETEDAPVAILREAFSIHGALDILVCNAGGASPGAVVDHDAASINRTIALNLRAVILSTAEYGRLTASPHGRVIVISSGAASQPAGGASIYSAAKAGAEAFVRSVAQEFGPRGITVNAVAPGMIYTDMVKDRRWIEEVAKWAALRRVGEPDDIADVVAFVASDEARWLTGQSLIANGGQVASATTILSRTGAISI